MGAQINLKRTLFFLLVFFVFTLAHDGRDDFDNPDGFERSGERVCPCFCSVRTGDSLSPYWDDTFGPEFPHPSDLDEEGNPVPEPKCHSQCLDSGYYLSYMPFCAKHVTGFFCPRAFPGLNLSVTAQISALDTHAKTCVEGLLPKEKPSESQELYVQECYATMIRGACYIAFPQCKDDKPQAICQSFCVNERRGCRTLGSTYGHQDSIKAACAEPPWLPYDGPSELCTGGSLHATSCNSIYTSILTLVCALQFFLW